jgi:hypothetical protein
MILHANNSDRQFKPAYNFVILNSKKNKFVGMKVHGELVKHIYYLRKYNIEKIGF